MPLPRERATQVPAAHADRPWRSLRLVQDGAGLRRYAPAQRHRGNLVRHLAARGEAVGTMRLAALQQLARDVAEHFTCGCADVDLEDGDCPCGGDGPGDLEGCWRCQALAALAESECIPPLAPTAVPTPPQSLAAAGAANVESGAPPAHAEDHR